MKSLIAIKLNSLVTIKGEGVDKAASEAFKSAAGNVNVKADGEGNPRSSTC